MPDQLSFSVLDGPQVGETLTVTGTRASVGGKGSGADLEISGLPYGIKYIDLVQSGNVWSLVEFEPRTILINERKLKRRNKLSTGDIVWLPSLVDGQSLRLEAKLTAIKKDSKPDGAEGEEKKPMNPMIIAAIGVYVMLMLLGGAYFMMNSGGSGSGRGEVTIADVRDALTTDFEAIGTVEAGALPIGLGTRPDSFVDLVGFMNSTLGNEEKDAIESEFRDRVVALFSEAWRFEQQGRYSEARDNYQQIIKMMGQRKLQTTSLALHQYGLIEGR